MDIYFSKYIEYYLLFESIQEHTIDAAFMKVK